MRLHHKCYHRQLGLPMKIILEMPYVMFEVEYLWHGWVKQDVVNNDII